MLYLLCGLSFAGKSTLAREMTCRAGLVLVSLDAINAARGLAGGLGVPAAEWAVSHRIALARTAEELARGRSVIVDDTNCFRFLRDDYREVAARHGATVMVVYLPVPAALLRARRSANDESAERPRIADEVFLDLARKFEPPGADEATLLFPSGADPARWVTENIVPALPLPGRGARRGGRGHSQD